MIESHILDFATADVVVFVPQGILRSYIMPDGSKGWAAKFNNEVFGIDFVTGYIVPPLNYLGPVPAWRSAPVGTVLTRTYDSTGPRITFTDSKCQLQDLQGGDYLMEIGAVFHRLKVAYRSIPGLRFSPPPCTMAFVVVPGRKPK